MKDTYANPWIGFADRWNKYYRLPGRPSKQAISVYKKLIQKTGIKKPRILIHGSTPELRDAARKISNNVTIIDINKNMIDEMTKLCRLDNKKEKRVRADWTNMPFESGCFDIILGDVTFQNIPYDKQKFFLDESTRVLKKNGYWITKMMLIPDDWEFMEFDEALNSYTQAAQTKEASSELTYKLLYNTWDKKHTVSMKIMRNWMDKYKTKDGSYKHQNPKITQFLNDIWEFWKPLDKTWALSYEKDIIKQISCFFEIIDRKILDDCIDPNVDESFPIYLCRKK